MAQEKQGKIAQYSTRTKIPIQVINIVGQNTKNVKPLLENKLTRLMKMIAQYEYDNCLKEMIIDFTHYVIVNIKVRKISTSFNGNSNNILV